LTKCLGRASQIQFVCKSGIIGDAKRPGNIQVTYFLA